MPKRDSIPLTLNEVKAFDAANPIAFNLHDDEGAQQIYILNDQSPGRTHHLVLFNHSKDELKFQTAINRNSEAGNHHLELRFRPGTLDLDHLSWLNLGTAGWRLAYAWEESEDEKLGQVKDGIHDLSVSLYLLYTDGELTLKPGSALVVILHLLKAAVFGGSRGSRVELRYYSDGETIFTTPSDVLLHKRQVRLQIINQRGKKELPMVAAFEGSSTVLNNGDTSNNLILQVSNFLQNSTIPLHGRDHHSPSKFILSFDTSEEQAAWALCDADNAAAIDVEVHFEAKDGIDWHIRPELQGNNPQWIITLNDELPLQVGDFFHLHLDGLKTSQPSGFTPLYLLYQNVPGYWDGRFEIPIEKSPLKFADEKDNPDHRKDGRFIQKTKVGIGNLEPKETLDVNGGVEAETLVLRRTEHFKEKIGTDDKVVVDNQGNPVLEEVIPLKVNGKVEAERLSLIGKINSKGAKFTKSTDGVPVLETDGDANIHGKLSTTDLEVTGTLKVTGTLADSLGTLLPSGAIIMWSGSKTPSGWVLCDGKDNKTPDLRGRFIVGYDQDRLKDGYDNPGDISNGGTKNGSTGGEEQHLLTTSEMPHHNHSATQAPHSHSVKLDYSDGTKDGTNYVEGSKELGSDNGSKYWSTNSKQPSIDVGFTGGSLPHENRPPYYVLAFIMKL